MWYISILNKGWCNAGVRTCIARTGMGPIQPCQNANQNFFSSLANWTQFSGATLIQQNIGGVNMAIAAPAA
jgi:hypothetical protein